MTLRTVAGALTFAQAAIWLAIQPGLPLMGDITREDDGGFIQGLAVLIPATLLAWRFAAFRGSWGFLLWNSGWAVVWTAYSGHHVARWASGGAGNAGNVWLLVPELFVVLHVLALGLGSAAVFRAMRERPALGDDP